MPSEQESAQREREYIASQLHIPVSELVRFPYYADIQTVRGKIALNIHWLDDTPDGVIRDGQARGSFVTDIELPIMIGQSFDQEERSLTTGERFLDRFGEIKTLEVEYGR